MPETPTTNSFACESENGVIACAYPNPDSYQPHVGLHLSHLSGPEGRPVVLVSRLSPDDARAIAASLLRSADRIQPAFDAYLAEIKAEGTLGD